MTVDFDNYITFFLVMLRMTGMLVFNPIFGRRNVPTMVNAALALVLAVLLSGSVPAPDFPTPTLLTFLYWVVKELLLGLLAGFFFQMFTSVLIVGGEMVDMQLGISMAKAFDPGSNASISLSAQLFNIMFILTFFNTNTHLTLIQMFAQSFHVLPLGSYLINPDALYAIPELFTTILLLAVKLALPVIVVEIIVTFAVGILMRIIPQINVFVVNIQFKLLIGMFVLLVLVPSFVGFIENLLILCTENIQRVWLQLIS